MDARAPANLTWHEGRVTREERWRALGCRGGTVWLTGLSGSGKSTIAAALEAELVRRGISAYRLDGDNIRHGLNRDLGFSAADRAENIRRIAEVARLLAEAGCIVIASFISPYRTDREAARRLHAEAGLTFIEVFIDAPTALCEQRDPKGLYRKARAGELAAFTGIDAPYEPPINPDLVLRTAELPVEASVERLLDRLRKAGLVQAAAP
jgi:adenylylsulfate kinase